jgi:hypothetical protein
MFGSTSSPCSLGGGFWVVPWLGVPFTRLVACSGEAAWFCQSDGFIFVVVTTPVDSRN